MGAMSGSRTPPSGIDRGRSSGAYGFLVVVQRGQSCNGAMRPYNAKICSVHAMGSTVFGEGRSFLVNVEHCVCRAVPPSSERFPLSRLPPRLVLALPLASAGARAEGESVVGQAGVGAERKASSRLEVASRMNPLLLEVPCSCLVSAVGDTLWGGLLSVASNSGVGGICR